MVEYYEEIDPEEPFDERLRRLREQTQYELERELLIRTNQEKIRRHERAIKHKNSADRYLLESIELILERATRRIAQARYAEAKELLEFRGVLPEQVAAALGNLRPIRDHFQTLYQRQAFDLLRTGQFFQVVHILQPLRSRQLLTPASYYALAKALRMTGNLVAAADAIDCAIEGLSRFPHWYLEKAQTWLDIAIVRHGDLDLYLTQDEPDKIRKAGRAKLKQAQDNAVEALGGAYALAPRNTKVTLRITRILGALAPTGEHIPIDVTPLTMRGFAVPTPISGGDDDSPPTDLSPPEDPPPLLPSNESTDTEAPPSGFSLFMTRLAKAFKGEVYKA